MEWSLEVVVLPVRDIDRSVAFYRDRVGFQDPDGNSWTVQEIKARATKPLIPTDHTGLSEWAGR